MEHDTELAARKQLYKDICQYLRIKLTGKVNHISVFVIMELLGKEETLRRLNAT